MRILSVLVYIKAKITIWTISCNMWILVYFWTCMWTLWTACSNVNTSTCQVNIMNCMFKSEHINMQGEQHWHAMTWHVFSPSPGHEIHIFMVNFGGDVFPRSLILLDNLFAVVQYDLKSYYWILVGSPMACLSIKEKNGLKHFSTKHFWLQFF